VTTFGERLKELRKERNLSQKALAKQVAINFTYLSKIENERLDFAQFPSEELICKLALALAADEDELLILARKVPPKIKERVLARPDAFRIFADLDDSTLNSLIVQVGGKQSSKQRSGGQG
jgi:transcriptional regulator with XRE-family HTH domain